MAWTDLERVRINQEIDRAYQHQKNVSKVVLEKMGSDVILNCSELHPAEWRRQEEIENLISTFPPEAECMELIKEWADIWTRIGRKYLFQSKKQRGQK